MLSNKMLVLVFIGAVISMAHPIWNGGAFYYFDTSSYIEKMTKIINVLLSTTPEKATSAQNVMPNGQAFGVPQTDNVVLGGRSVYYGALLYIGWITNIWLPIFVQSLVLSWLVLMTFKHLSFSFWEYKALAALCVVSLLSSASLFVGLLMPDIWVGLLVLALCLLWTFDATLAWKAKMILFLILVYSTLAHSSHLALLAAMMASFVLMRAVPSLRRHTSFGLLAIPAGALFVGTMGSVAYSSAVRITYGADLVERPFLTAHLTDLGPGTRVAQQTCPDSEFVICQFADRLPVGWIEFLFNKDPQKGVFAAASPSQKKALSDEQMEFALRTVMAEPLTTLGGLAADGVSQLWKLSVDDVALTSKDSGYISANFPPDLIRDLETTRVYEDTIFLDKVYQAMQFSAALSSLVLLFWIISGFGYSSTKEANDHTLDKVIFILSAGVVLNALICGVLASPYGRFQARIVWLLPLIAVLILSSITSWKFPKKQPLLK